MKKMITLALAVICIAPINCIEASAEELITKDSGISNSTVYSVGLINGYSLSIASSSNSILLSGKTNCLSTMKSVGLKDIVIQYSSDNSHWYKYKTIDDLLATSSFTYSATNKSIATVSNGYYYRIICNHYAKENGLFGSSESISNTSNSIYIS